MDAESAEVSDSDDVKLFSSPISFQPTLPRRFLNLSRLLKTLTSSPVLKSTSKRCTNPRPPAKGQIESEVVADVKVPSTGERRERRRGGSISVRSGVGVGINGSGDSLGRHLPQPHVQIAHPPMPLSTHPQPTASGVTLPSKSAANIARNMAILEICCEMGRHANSRA